MKRVQFGVYETDNMPDFADVKLPERLQRKLDRDGWELAATIREEDQLVWLLYREDGETVEDLFAVVWSDDRLVLAKLEGDLNELIWPVPDIIAALSRLFALAPGDLIYTGTPSGVGPIRPGERLDAKIEGVGTLTVTVGDAA